MKVEQFKIDHYGELEVSAYKNCRKQSYTWHNVPKSIILKFLNSKSAPDTSDIDTWMRDYETKRKKQHKDDVSFSFGFWDKE